MKIVSRSHEGLVRVNNEDCVHVDSERGFVVVADGMGGLLAGEEASSVAVEAICQRLIDEKVECTTADDARALILYAHEQVLARAGKLNYLGKMGTTLLLWVSGSPSNLFAHVGDSRLYGFDGEQVVQITSDHTVAQRMIDMGKFPADQAYRAPNRHVLTQAIGLPGVVVPDQGVLPGYDRYLLCSDGLSDMVRDPQLARFLAIADIDDSADQLLRAALDEGGRDNVTLALIDL